VRGRLSDGLLVATGILLGLATCAHAQIPFPAVMDRVLGVRRDAPHAWPGPTGGVRIEFADMELFGVPGLRLSGVRVTGSAHGWPLGAELTRLGSAVGSHARATVLTGRDTRGWCAAARLGVESLSLDGVPGESAIVTGLVTGVEVGGASLVADIESIAGGGERAVFMTVAVAGRVGGRATVFTSMRYDGPQALAVGVAAVVPVHRALALLAGYDDGTETARVAASIQAGKWTLATGAFRHAVLGVSQGVTVSAAW
jgi:hypothetical protein